MTVDTTKMPEDIEELAKIIATALDKAPAYEDIEFEDHRVQEELEHGWGMNPEDIEDLTTLINKGQVQFKTEYTNLEDLAHNLAEALFDTWNPLDISDHNIEWWTVRNISGSDYNYFFNGKRMNDEDSVRELIAHYSNEL